jgi:hypothetical protein
VAVLEVAGALVAYDDGDVAFQSNMLLGFAPRRLDPDEDVQFAEDLGGLAVDELAGAEEGEVVVVAGITIFAFDTEERRREGITVDLGFKMLDEV